MLSYSFIFRDSDLTKIKFCTLDPAREGVFRRYGNGTFSPDLFGNPYPMGIDPVSCIAACFCRKHLSKSV